VGEAEDIATYLLYSPQGLCIECLAGKTGMATERVHDAVSILRRDWHVILTDGNCARCLKDRPLLALP
jgi:hypothetical protein